LLLLLLLSLLLLLPLQLKHREAALLRLNKVSIQAGSTSQAFEQ
jgi:hypothetical protein